jgi:GTPase
MAYKKNYRPKLMRFKSKVVPDSPTVAASATHLVKPGLVDSQFPTIALVGRPNVGKSSIFNALVKQEVSITDARAGTTRDRVLQPVVFHGKPCDLLDTGGIGIIDSAMVKQEVEDQIQKAIHAATIICMVVDAKDGLTPLDRQVAARLRTLGRPMMLCANKIEGKEAGLSVAEFSELGIEPIIGVSAMHRIGFDELTAAFAAVLPEEQADNESETWQTLPRIAVVGRRNVGKSSFCNALAREERCIVSPLAGTTRDAVDMLLEKDNRRFCLVDTAGLRRMKEAEGPVEFFSQVRTERAIRRADVVLLMLSARDGVSTTDRKTADMILEDNKPCVIVVNKWDEAMAENVDTGEFVKYIEGRLPTLRHAPVAFTTAITGRRCWQTIDVALDIYDQASTQVPTPELNKIIVQCEEEHEPPAAKGHKPRLLYGVQVAVRPITFVIHCRHSELIDKRYLRYLSLRLRELLNLSEVPVRLFLREAAK